MLIADIIVVLLIGVGIGWVARAPGADWVSKSSYDELQSNYDSAKAELDSALAKIEKLTKTKKVGLILATGGLGDKSFNDLSMAGVQRAKDELRIEFDYVEPKAIARAGTMRTIPKIYRN